MSNPKKNSFKNTLFNVLQYISGIIFIAAYIPQIRLILVTQSSAGASLGTFLSICVGAIILELYAIHKKAWALVVTNGAATLAAGLTGLLIIIYR